MFLPSWTIAFLAIVIIELTEARRSLETNRGNSAGGRHIQALRRRIAANRNMKQLKWSYAPTERPSMSVGRETNLGRRIAEFENEICEPEKRHLDLEGCGKCICRSHGYGSICEKVKCPRYYKRPVELRECEPFKDFTTTCHFCKCSASGIPIGCIEKRRRCMEDILDELEHDRDYPEQSDLHLIETLAFEILD